MGTPEIFISWSKEASKKAAVALKDFIPVILQAEAWYSDQIQSGNRWQAELAKNLEVVNTGIIILAPENIFEPWPLYEAGAIVKNDKSRIIPYLLSPSLEGRLPGPFNQFQARLANKSGTLQMFLDINKNLPVQFRTAEYALKQRFESTWTLYENQINNAVAQISVIPATWPYIQFWPNRADREEERVDLYERCIKDKKVKNVDLVGLALNTDFFAHSKLGNSLIERLNEPDFEVRIFISDPQREEYLWRKHSYGENDFPILLRQSLYVLTNILHNLPTHAKDRFRVHLVNSVIYAMILRFGDTIIFSNYLSSGSGKAFPIYGITKSANPNDPPSQIYASYLREIELGILPVSRPVGYKQLESIVNQKPLFIPSSDNNAVTIQEQTTVYVHPKNLFTVVKYSMKDKDSSDFQRVVIKHRHSTAIVAMEPISNRVILIHHRRHAINKEIWEIPGGIIKEGESGDACAIREFREETGLEIEKPEFLIRFYPEPAFGSHHIDIYKGFVIGDIPADGKLMVPKNERDISSVQAFLPNEITDMIKKEDIASSWSVIGLSRVFEDLFVRR